MLWGVKTMEDISRIKWKIKEILDQRNMTIYQLSAKAEITDACIRNWYTKRNYTPSLVAIIKVCNALEIPLTELLKEDDDEFVCVGEAERSLLSNWALLNEKQKGIIKTLMETFLEK